MIAMVKQSQKEQRELVKVMEMFGLLSVPDVKMLPPHLNFLNRRKSS